MPLVHIDGSKLLTWGSFHSTFATTFGFPAFYGRNMDAWIDCMTYLDDPDTEMTSVHGSNSDPVVLQIDNVDAVPAEIFKSLVDCGAFVNWRRLETGRPAILMLSYCRSPE